MKVTEIRDDDALTELRAQWEELLVRAPKASIYQTWEWNDAWWAAYRRGKAMRVLLVHDADRLVGIAPLYVSRHFRTPLRRLAFIGTGASDYLDVIVDQEVSVPAIRALLAYLHSARGYDLADLQQVPVWSPLPQVAAQEGSSACICRPLETCPYVPLPESWEAFARTRSKRLRSNIGYYDRLLQRSFAGVETGLAARNDLDDALAALFDLHTRRWRSRMMPGVLSGAAAQRFHRDVAQRFLERGWLRLHTTRLDGRIVAGLYCFSYRGRYYYYLGGFDPALARYSIGTTLTASAIRQAIEEGCTEFDFLRGHEAYKYRWTPDERTNDQVLVRSMSGWRSSALLRLNNLERRIERWAKEWSDRGKGTRRQRGPREAAAPEGVQVV